MKTIVLALINFYRCFISPVLPPRCRFYPSCSSYCSEAVEKYGLIKGFYLGGRRLLRCHPFCPGGYDPVPVWNMQNEKDKTPEIELNRFYNWHNFDNKRGLNND